MNLSEIEYTPTEVEQVGDVREDARIIATRFHFRQHHGFQVELPISGVVPPSIVMVSISELHFEEGELRPFQGGASMEVHNVVPRFGGKVIVRGFADVGVDIFIQLAVFVAAP